MSSQRHPLVRDGLIVTALLAGSLTLLPAIIFTVGTRLFGSYNGGLQQFYLDTFHDLLKPTWSAWMLALTPALCALALRLIFRRADQPAGHDPADPTDTSSSNDSSDKPIRQEPTLN